MSNAEPTGRVPAQGGPKLGTPRVIHRSVPLDPQDVADSTSALVDTYARSTVNGVAVADGMGLRVYVNRGALVVEDGMGPHRRSRRFDKATHGLRRLVIIGTTGVITLDGLAWGRRLGVGVLVLDHTGAAVLASTPRMTDDPRVRRMQALAPNLPVGLDIARTLLGRKLAGQAELLRHRFSADEPASVIDGLTEGMAGAATVDEARQLEASAAAIFWGSWVSRSECGARFTTRDRARVPPHWTLYENRRSVLASVSSNRKAERPANALLNYLYALLEAEAVLACQVVGLDPGLGIVHNDTRQRQSMALDVMEPIRPAVDAFVLDLLAQRTFRKSDFAEASDGAVRLRSPLTHELAASLPTWARAVAPIAEYVAHQLGQAMAGKYQSATPLTASRAKSAQALVKARRAAVRARSTTGTRARQQPGSPTAPTLWSCPDCGAPVTNPRHTRCESCIDADPAQTPEIRANRGAAIAARKRALREWDHAHPDVDYDPGAFRRLILPGLQGVKLTDIAQAAGISKGYASNVRAGKFTPHVSTWAGLAALVGVALPDGS